MKRIVMFSIALCATSAFADVCSVKMLPGEHWWGVCNDFGREMPFTEKSNFSCDLRLDNYSHQSLSFLCSDKGRAVWCEEPVGVKIANGKIALESDKGEIVLKENAGRNLAEAFRYAAKTWFLPTGEEPELFIRSAQVHALCPMMQISASPWRVLSPEHQRIFRDVVALRQKFAPRFVELAKESAKTGEPMMRNLEYCFPGIGYADIKDEFMMGQDLLVAPVLEKGAKHRRVVIPPGRWRGDDGKAVEGPTTIEVSTPLERLPHFIRMSGEVLRSRCSTEKRDSVKGAS